MFAVRRQGGLAIDGDRVSVDELVKRLKIVMAMLFIFVVALSLVFGAPLTLEADQTAPPNPAKSAWFLLWLQEIVSWETWYINFILLIYVAMFFFYQSFRDANQALAGSAQMTDPCGCQWSF